MPCPYDPTTYKGEPHIPFACPICNEPVNPGLPHPVFDAVANFDEYDALQQKIEDLMNLDETTEAQDREMVNLARRVHQYEIEQGWAFHDFITLCAALTHFQKIGKIFPVSSEASLLFIGQEVSEASEVLAARYPYNRNNPQNKPARFDADKYAEELGDVIFMALISGALEGVDPIRAMLAKMRRQDEKHAETNPLPTASAQME